MGTVKADQRLAPNWANRKLVYSAILVAFLLAVALYVNNQQVLQSVSVFHGIDTISQNTLEEQYGLRVTLLAATAAGGLVDVRLKLVDGDKAKSLLSDPKNYPSLWIAKSNINLAISEENRADEIQFEDNGNLFLLFPNAHGIVKPGTPVTIRFGNIQLEPIPAK